MLYTAQEPLYVDPIQHRRLLSGMAVGPKLAKIRKRSGYSVRGMAKLLGFSHGSGYQYWEQGAGADRSHLTPELAAKMRALIGVGDPPITQDDIAELFPQVFGGPVREVPVVSMVSAGALREVTEARIMEAADETISVCDVPETTLALRVSGSSMNRIAPEGSLILVDYSQRDMTPGDFYVVQIEGQATFKRFRSDPARLEPLSTEQHDIIFLGDKPVEVVGRAFEVITRL